MARSSCSCRQDRQEQYRFNIMPLETVLSSILSFGLALKGHNQWLVVEPAGLFHGR